MRNRLRQALFVVLIGLVLASAAFGADLKLGDLPPPLKLPNFQEKTVELEPLLGQKAVLITFVAGWSKNCQAELLALQKVNESYSKRGLVILAVNLEKGTQNLDKFFASNRITYEILKDKKMVTLSPYQILVIPTSYLIAPNGRLEQIYVDFDDNTVEKLQKDLDVLLPNKKS